MPVIETKRLIVRDFAMADTDDLNDIFTDAQVTRYMHFATWNAARRRQWLEWIVQNHEEVDIWIIST